LNDNQAMTSPTPSPSRSAQAPAAHTPINPQQSRTGVARLWYATGHSIEGFKAAWGETAFRQEAVASLVLLPASFWLGRGWVEIALLAGSLGLVMIVELLNTGIEAAIDRIGPERHELSKRAKDMGSAAVLLSLVLAGAIWLAALGSRFLA
jgi:diacylglycerol kinase (ATP)